MEIRLTHVLGWGALLGTLLVWCFDSIMRLIQSRMDVSIVRFLKPEEETD